MVEQPGPMRAQTVHCYKTVTVSELTVGDTTNEDGTLENTVTEQYAFMLIRNGVQRVDWAGTGRG